jgi:hypothetical protein
VRQESSRPLVADMRIWFEAQHVIRCRMVTPADVGYLIDM